MSQVHIGIGIAVLASNGLAAAWGGVAWGRGEPSTVFWYLLRAAQAVVVAEAIVGTVLLLQGRDAGDPLHYVYGIAPLVISIVSEGARVGAAQAELRDVADPNTLERREQVLLARRIVLREIGVMTIGTILIFTLALRAAATGA
ncbi:MAG: hypothetical protein QOD53_618 [Thermoleophilaceae bacterium]|nr:hypothetical protein [Thermoleophilaceae bacterium]MEA2403932.1 hypothetical protein [Thermoleophilaceae bacterium]